MFILVEVAINVAGKRRFESWPFLNFNFESLTSKYTQKKISW